ncbi:MAG: glycerol-3-phosphate acyltransferase [Caldilineaceae bacterium]|nr:glycerol-3-phosphate acyltransferase [Caldilineaceae bacterium]
MDSPYLYIPAAILIGYLLGAVPVGFLACRIWAVDIRTVGSGRTGATNAWRAAGLKAALPTALGDALKGVAAVALVRWLLAQLAPAAPADLNILAAAAAGGAAVLGHNWSVFLGFKGGAGGITCALTCLALNPIVGLIVVVVGAAMMWWARIAAIATLSTGVVSLAGFLALASNRIVSWSYLAFAIPACLAIIISLRSNREKLRQQDERIITLW